MLRATMLRGTMLRRTMVRPSPRRQEWGRSGRCRRRAAGSAGTAAARSLSSENQLQKFLRVIEPLLEFRAEAWAASWAAMEYSPVVDRRRQT